jgi:hypothetical protein
MALKWLTALCDEDSLFNLKLDIVVVDGDIVERRTAGLDLNGPLNSVYRKVNVYDQRAVSHRRATLEHERNYWGAWSGRINLDGSRIHYIDVIQRGADARYRILEVERRSSGDRHRDTVHLHSALKRDGPIYINCAGETATDGGSVQCKAVAASALGIAAGNVGEIVPVIVPLLRAVTVLAMDTSPSFKKALPIVLGPATAMPPNNAGSPVQLAVPSLMGLKGQRTRGCY